MERDLTVGKPITAILKYTLPLFGSIIFQQLYNIADSLVAGRYIGTDALAAVGNGYEIRKEAYKVVLNKVKGLLESYVDTRDNKNLYIKMCENFGIEVEE